MASKAKKDQKYSVYRRNKEKYDLDNDE